MLQLFMCGVLVLLLIVGIVLFAAVIILTIEIVIRIWPNYITPWLDEHFGESD